MNNEKGYLIFPYTHCSVCVHAKVSIEVYNAYSTRNQLPELDKIMNLIAKHTCERCTPSQYVGDIK